MASFETEIKPVYVRPDRSTPQDFIGIQVTTKGTDYIHKTVSAKVYKKDSDETYRQGFLVDEEVKYKFVSQFPTVESFKQTLERERMILLSRGITWYAGIAGSTMFGALMPLWEGLWGIPLIAIPSGLYAMYGNIPFIGSRLGRPGMCEEVIDAEAKAFKENYPDQELREYNPLKFVKGLKRVLRHNN